MAVAFNNLVWAMMQVVQLPVTTPLATRTKPSDLSQPTEPLGNKATAWMLTKVTM